MVPIAHFKSPLETTHLFLRASQSEDLKPLFAIGSDPEVWSLHSETDRYTKEKFSAYFESGLCNELGAYTLIYKSTGEVAGFTRYYDYDSVATTVKIGYTFLSKVLWGKGLNQELKKAMIDHAFEGGCTQVIFEVFERNFRSQRAVLKLGALEIEPRGDRKRFALFRTDAFSSLAT
ncbi:MAG: GNAT family N-acetyltransferase [Flavobacteriaceae bacterium]